MGSFQISYDSGWVVYTADQHADGQLGVFSLPIQGGDFIELKRGSVSKMQITSDDQYVVFWDGFRVTSVPLTGGPILQLNPADSATVVRANDRSFRVSPDGRRVLFPADGETDGVRELYSTPLDRREPVRISQDLNAVGNDVSRFQVTSDGRFAVYLADHDNENQTELYSVATATGRITKLNGAAVDGAAVDVVRSFDISPDSRIVVFQAPGGELYSVPVEGGANTPLSDGAAAKYQITMDSARVVFLSDHGNDGTTDLLSVSLFGGVPTELSGDDGSVHSDFQLTGDGTRVVYRADQDMSGVVELYSVPVSGGGTTKLNVPLGAGRTIRSSFLVSPDSSRVVYTGDQDTDNVFEIYSVPVAGGEPEKLNAPLASGGDVRDATGAMRAFQIAADSSRVVYLADQDFNNILELYSVPLAGGSPVKISGQLFLGRNVEPGFEISPDSSRVVYRADQDTDQLIELYSTPITSGPVTKLNAVLSTGDRIFEEFRISAGSDRVVYAVNQTGVGSDVLYSVPVAGGSAQVINDPPATGAELTQFQITPDGRQVIYRSDQDMDGVVELFATAIDTGGSTKVNQPMQIDGIGPYQVTADGTRVVYQANPEVAAQIGLYMSSLTDLPRVTAVVPNTSGVSVEFNHEIAVDGLSLYGSESSELGDFVVQDAAGEVVAGSLLARPSGRQFDFIKSGTPLEPGAYLVRLRGADGGFVSLAGQRLDGNADGAGGDDYVGEFTIPQTGADSRTVSVPDFARGPGQTVHLPADTGTGIPLSISNGADVKTVSLRISYDPRRLDIADASPGPTMPEGTTVEFDSSVPGNVTLEVSSPTGLPSGERVVATLAATVPSMNAEEHYAQSHVLDIHDVVLVDAAANLVPSNADDGLHVVVFLGDASGNRIVNAADASRTARIASLLESGLAAFPFTDFRLLVDINGNGRVEAGDASQLARFAAEFHVPQIPPTPGDPNSLIYAQAVLDDQPIAYWRLDELFGPTAFDSGPQRFNGTYVGEVALGAAGSLQDAANHAASFSGSEGFVDVGVRPQLSQLTNGFSIEAWVWLPSGGGGTVVANRTSDYRAGYGLHVNAGLMIFTTFGVKDYFARQVVIPEMQWTHVTVVFDESNDASFFLNGELIQKVEGLLPARVSTETLNLGRQPVPGLTGTHDQFRGRIDEVAIYGRALSPQEIRGHYAAR